MAMAMAILNIDLSKAIIGIPSGNNTPVIWVVFWWRDLPLGHIFLDELRLPVSSNRLTEISLSATQTALDDYATRSNTTPCSRLRFPDSASGEEALDLAKGIWLQKRLKWLDDLSVPTPANLIDAFSISLIIPTCNRPAALADCLDSVFKLTEQPNEIVVVDNAPDRPGARDVVREFDNVSYIPESIVGSSAARNTGVQNCSGKIIAFLDDDERVHPNWLSAIKKRFYESQVDLVTGLVLPAELESDAQLEFEQRFSFVRGYCRKKYDYKYYLGSRIFGVPVWEIGGSGNLAIRRTVFDKLGGFDPRLGAGTAGCSEDSELFYNALYNRYRCDYEPAAVVYHQHRNDIESLKQQRFNYMRGHVAALLIQFAKYRDIGNLIRLFGILPIVYLRYFIRAMVGDPAFPKGRLLDELKGCLSGFRYYIKEAQIKSSGLARADERKCDFR